MDTSKSTASATQHSECTGCDFVEPSPLSAEVRLTAQEQERQLTNFQALRKYWKGLLWALFISLTVVLGGFDAAVSNTLIANPVFQKKFGYEYDPINSPGAYTISTTWQIGMLLGFATSQMVGAIIIGPVADRFGRKRPIYACLFGNMAFVFLQMFGTSFGMIFAGFFLNGCCYGVYFVLAPTYASEVVPHHLRHITIAFSNMALITGALLAKGTATAALVREDDLSYRIPFALQWFWVLIIMAGLAFCPESPWYNVHKGDFKGAKKALTKLAVARSPEDLPALIAHMQQTNELERRNQKETSYLQCLKGTDLRRTEIATMPFLMQIISSTTFLALQSYFLQLTGMPATNSFYIAVGTNALGWITNLLFYPMMVVVGRRTIYMWGSFTMFVLFFIVGFLDLPSDYDTNSSYSWAQSMLLLVSGGILNLTTAPSSWVIMSETPSTRLRSRTVSIAVMIQNIISIPILVGLPYEINPTEANWRGKTGFFYSGLVFMAFVWSFFRLPEMKGRNYEELDILFQRKVSARQFSMTSVDLHQPEAEPEMSDRV